MKEDKDRFTIKINVKTIFYTIFITIIITVVFSFIEISIVNEKTSFRESSYSGNSYDEADDNGKDDLELQKYICGNNLNVDLSKIRMQDQSWFTNFPNISGRIYSQMGYYFNIKINIAYVKGDKKFSQYLASRRASIVDAIMHWTSGQKPDYLDDVANRCKIKKELMNILRDLLYESEKLLDISFSRFQIINTL